MIQAIEDMSKLDTTLIIYISGDNGNSAAGTVVGTPNQFTAYNGILDLPIAEQMKAYDAWGSEATYPHMSVAWSWAFDTPFKWTNGPLLARPYQRPRCHPDAVPSPY